MTALERGIGHAFTDGARPGLDRIARAALEAAQLELAARIASKKTLYAGSGAQCMSAVASDEAVVVAWLGCARAYHGGREVTVLRRDHSLVEDHRRFAPDLTEKALERVPQGILTRTLGVEPAATIDTVAAPARAGRPHRARLGVRPWIVRRRRGPVYVCRRISPHALSYER